MAMPETMDGASTGTVRLLDPDTRQEFGSFEISWEVENEVNKITIEKINMSQAVTNQEEVIGGMIKELAYANPEMEIAIATDIDMGKTAGADLAALEKRLIAENPRGAEYGLQYYQEGDRFFQTREMNRDIELLAKKGNVSRESARDFYQAADSAYRAFGLDTHEMIGRQDFRTDEELRAQAAANPEGVEAQIARQIDRKQVAAQRTGEKVSGGMVVIAIGEDGGSRIVSGAEADGIAFDKLRAITVLTKDANPSTLHHEWLHFMAEVVIPNSPRYKAMLEDAVGKKLENWTRADHEKLAENYERYLRTGEAPTPGLRSLFRRIADALRHFVREGNVSPELRNFFDRMLAGPDAALLNDESSRQAGETQSRARVRTDNGQQRAYAEMTEAERVLQSDLYTQGEKAEMLFATGKEITKEEQQKRVTKVLSSDPIIVDTTIIPFNDDIKQ